MIEVTQNQENIILARIAEFLKADSNFDINAEIHKGLLSYTRSLSKEQRIALVEEIGLSVVEWVAFNKDDESTWPNKSLKRVCIKMVEDGTTIASRAWLVKFRKAEVATHWCELPQRKESK